MINFTRSYQGKKTTNNHYQISGDPNSEVFGHFTKEGIFSGVVYTEEDTIHIEPSHRFGVTTSHNVCFRFETTGFQILIA